MGVIGKAQLAAAYAKRHRKGYLSVYWLNVRDQILLPLAFGHVRPNLLSRVAERGA